jgi:hypothetical protein
VAQVLDEDVLRLEVAVHDAEAVEVFESEHQLRRVELDGGSESGNAVPTRHRRRRDLKWRASGAPVDGEPNDGVGGHDAAEGREQWV